MLALAMCAGVPALAGCEQDDSDTPRGGGYTAQPAPAKTTDADYVPAKSALGKARESANRLVDEDIAEYNKKLEQAADEAFPK